MIGKKEKEKIMLKNGILNIIRVEHQLQMKQKNILKNLK